MATALGLLGLVGFIVGVIIIASAVTWTVVKLSPQRRASEERTP